MSGWVPLELSPPPPVEVGEVLWVSAKRGCHPFSFCPPPPSPPLPRKALADSLPAPDAEPPSTFSFCTRSHVLTAACAQVTTPTSYSSGCHGQSMRKPRSMRWTPSLANGRHPKVWPCIVAPTPADGEVPRVKHVLDPICVCFRAGGGHPSAIRPTNPAFQPLYIS